MTSKKGGDRFTVTKACQDNQETLEENETQHDELLRPTEMALYEDDIQSRGTMLSLLKKSPTTASMYDPNSHDEQYSKKKLGTLFGVYLPTIQNIFGVLLFIRVTWIVGMAGALEAFLIVFLCCCSTTLTTLSMSAIATNGIVPAGGSYFMISRALGPEFGGAVGLLFFLGFTVAGSMYVIGAIEILVTFIAPEISLFGDVTILSNAQNNYRVFGTILLFILFIICCVGVEFVTKYFGPLSLFCVIFSIICIYIGLFAATPENSKEICYLGERLLALWSVTRDGHIMCTKNETGPIFHNYCTLGDNNETVCDSYFLAHDTTLKPAMPGVASGIFLDNLHSRYTNKRNLIGFNQPGNRLRGEIIADTTTSFTVLMAIYFPSVTGVMTGSNMSGDLKDAQKSIPRGTLAAVLSTSAVYLSCVLIFAAGVEGDLLRDKLGESIGGGLVIAYAAWPSKWVVLVGSFLSTVGAGMQSINGAPRLLYAIANDNVVPFLQIFGQSRRGEPFYALLLTVCIAETGVLIGNLDHVTPIITMFFLMCYLFVNLACALQTILRAPSWRPRYKFYHWTLSLLGAGLCTTLMIISSWYYALVAFAMAGGIYKYIEYKGAEKEWGDGISGMAISLARYSLLRVQQTSPHTKNWRPQLLVLCKLDDDRKPKYNRLAHFAAQLKAGKGLTLLCSVIEGVYEDKREDVKIVKENLQTLIDKCGVKGFDEVVVSKDLGSGCCTLIQTAGLGGLKPNTVVIGWPNRWKQGQNDTRYRLFIENIQHILAAEKALLVVKGTGVFPTCAEKMRGTIDIWWIVHDGGLLVLLPYLLQQHKTWKYCKLRLFTVAQYHENNIQMKKDLKKFMYQLRIEADVEVIDMYDNDISEYTVERTLRMEQRIQMMKKLKMQSSPNPQSIVDNIHRLSRQSSRVDSVPMRHEDAVPIINGDISIVIDSGDNDKEEKQKRTIDDKDRIKHKEEREEDSGSESENSASSSQSGNRTVEEMAETVNRDVENIFDGEEDERKPNERNVKRMHTAVKLNEAMRQNSTNACLVIVNLPPPPRMSEAEAGELEYMEFLEVLTEGIDRVLMVRGTGSEVITIYS